MNNTNKSEQDTVVNIKHTNLLSVAIIVVSLVVLVGYFMLNLN
jgi:hypothetical protein